MYNIKLISDSSCDFTNEDIALNDVNVVPFSVSFDDKNYLKENIDIDKYQFYEKLSDPNLFPKTSLPSVDLYLKTFQKHIENGHAILCLTLSSKLSGSYQAAINAKNIILDDNPDAQIEVIDTLQATFAQGLLVKFAHELIEEGKSLNEVAEIINKNRKNITIYLSLSSLKHLQKGGRISKVSALAGDILNVNPIIRLVDGELIPISKVRGKKKAFNSIAKLCNQFLEEQSSNNCDSVYYILTCLEDVSILTTKFEELGLSPINYRNVGVTISAHTGVTVFGGLVAKFNK